MQKENKFCLYSEVVTCNWLEFNHFVPVIASHKYWEEQNINSIPSHVQNWHQHCSMAGWTKSELSSIYFWNRLFLYVAQHFCVGGLVSLSCEKNT